MHDLPVHGKAMKTNEKKGFSLKWTYKFLGKEGENTSKNKEVPAKEEKSGILKKAMNRRSGHKSHKFKSTTLDP